MTDAAGADYARRRHVRNLIQNKEFRGKWVVAVFETVKKVDGNVFFASV